MYKLMLMRHAKSDWHSYVSDLERPLNERGVENAQFMGRYLKEHDLIPDQVLVSPAQRTQETLRHLSQDWGLKDKQVIVDKELYLADRETLIENASVYLSNKKRLMLLTHNPGMDDIVSYLASNKPKLTQTGKLMVTAAVAVFKFESLDDLQTPGKCELKALLRPKELI